MGLFNHIVIIGLIGGCFLLLIILIVCLVAIRRRRRVEINVEKKNLDFKYRRLIAGKPDALNFETKIPCEKEIVAAQSVSWAEPLTESRKPRSVSCPESPRIMSPPAISRANSVLLGKKRKGVKVARRRAKTDSCLRVCQVQFSIFYNYYHSKLFVKLICAVYIPSHFGVTYGSFMKAELLPNKEKAVHVTNIQYHSNNPVFNVSFEFPGISSDELVNTSLKIKLFTVDRFSHTNLVGTVLEDFAELEIDPEKPTTVWRPLTSQANRLSVVALKEVLDVGELYVSLRYQLLHNKLTVVVMKATNLPPLNKIFTINPYVVVELLLHLKTVQTRKTSCKRRTTSPCWNEPLLFEIGKKIPISEYSLCVKVMASNNLCEDVTLGEFDIGYHAEGLGKQHWKEMIVKKNQNRAMCHKIH